MNNYKVSSLTLFINYVNELSCHNDVIKRVYDIITAEHFVLLRSLIMLLTQENIT